MTNRPIYRMILTLAILLLTITAFAQEKSAGSDFWFGVDLSYANEMDDCGAVYHVEGETQDVFSIFADHGATLVRARLWHNPDWTDYSTLDDVKRTFQRAQDAGMSTLLDIHYSDNWADPSRQEIPAAWEDITDIDELADAVYQYTYDVLAELHDNELTPAFVQVGNETNSGMLKQEGEDLDWSRAEPLFNAGIRAVRDFTQATDTPTKILLHVAQPENTDWWFTEAEQAGITDFDVIGVSYYPQWSTFSIADMGAQAAYLKNRFGKDVMVVETAYGWTRDAVDETADNILNQGIRGYSFSPEGQLQFMTNLTQTLISNGAIGVVYWEPAWVSTECSTRWGQGSHWENATFFDFTNDNEVLEGIDFLNYAYWYPSDLQVDMDTPFVTDTPDDMTDIPALDLENLYITHDESSLVMTLTIAGDVYSHRGSYLFYIDTTDDGQGADVDPARRPITVADPYQPEFRLDMAIQNERGTNYASYTLNAWHDGEWEPITYTGQASIEVADKSTIQLTFPQALLDNPQMLNIAVISTPRGRASTAADILGIDFAPDDDSPDLVLDTFFTYSLEEN